MERRDAADALLDAEERARLQVPDRSWSPPAATRTGGRASPAPLRLAAAAEAHAAAAAPWSKLEQDRVPPRVEELDPARAARDGHDVQRARRRDVRDAGPAIDGVARNAASSARSRAPAARRAPRAGPCSRTSAGGTGRRPPGRRRSTGPCRPRRARRCPRRPGPSPGRSPRRRRAGGRRPSRSLCGNQNFTARRPESSSSSTPSTRRLLDGVAMPVPRRSTKPGRPRRRREMT